MEISQLIPHVEALIFAADRPLPAADILELLNNALAFLEDRATPEQVAAAIEAIQEKYSSEFYAFSVRESGGGYQFLTKRDYYQTVAQINGEKFLKRLSTAALETLAIIAYKQPISKGEIEHIRGVSTDYSITKLLEKELIIISGRSEELPGKPLLYSTSKAFMDYFGLNSPKDLPKLKEVFEEDFVPPTQLTLEAVENLEVDEETLSSDGQLIVTESGELTETTTILMEDEPSEEHTAGSPESSTGSGDGGGEENESDEDAHASGNSAGGDPEMADSGDDLEDELDEDGEIEAMLSDDKKDSEDEDEDDDKKDSEDEDEDDDDDDEDDEDGDEDEVEGEEEEASGPVPFEEDPYNTNDTEKADDEEQAIEDADDRLNDEEDESEDEEGREGK